MVPTRRRISLALVCLLALLAAEAPRAAARRLAQAGDAYVDAQGEAWTIGNDAVRLTLAVGDSGPQTSLTTTSGSDSLNVATPEPTFTVDGRPTTLTRQAGYAFAGATTGTYGRGVRLSLEFANRGEHLTVTRHFVVVPRAPAVVTWTSLTSDSTTPRTVASIAAWNADVSGARIAYRLTGLTDDGSGTEPFAVTSQPVEGGGALPLRSNGRSSDTDVPWIAIGGDQASFFGGVMWSGRWRMDVTMSAGRAHIAAGLDGTETTVAASHPVDGPRGFVGVAAGTDLTGVSSALVSLQDGLRTHDPGPPPVVYNTWFGYGASMDEEALRGEADRAARLGAEVFVVDAGWWLGSGEGSDFTTGLGSWTADPAKFPSGLRAFAEYVRSRGMKFGLWVEPERMALANVGRTGASSAWIASSTGSAVEATGRDSAQICLGTPAARAWITSWLSSLIAEAGVEYLKWDNNLWVDCTRTDHGHGALDGPFAHVHGLYQILADLRSRFPDLIVENCAQGGHRLDLELGSLTDVAWMDDRTSPSSRVRHNLSGLGHAFGASYLLSFVMPDAEDSAHAAAQSRMPGALGIGFRTDGFDEASLEALAREIAFYKQVRDIIQHGAIVPLSAAPPAGSDDLPEWDATSVVSTTSGDALVFVSINRRDAHVPAVPLRALDPRATYRLTTSTGEALEATTGEDLMTRGVDMPADGAGSVAIVLRKDAE